MTEARIISMDMARSRPAVSAGSRLAGATGPKPRASKSAKGAAVTTGATAVTAPKRRTPRPTVVADAEEVLESQAIAAAEALAAKPSRAPRDEVAGDESLEAKLASFIDFLQRRATGDYEVDEFGHDPELTDRVLLAAMRPLYRSWFRVETRGIENVPSEGGALIVANHSGTLALDSVMTQLALLDEHPAHRSLRMLGADLVFATPVVGELARKAGHTLACAPDAERLLTSGEVVGVWPEGFKGIGKPFSERYTLQRFGRGGFVSAALKARVPIIPVSIVGAEEIYPMIGNFKPLARILGMPYFPLTPTFPWLGPLGLVPLPSKWIISFGDPIPTDMYPPGASEDPMLVFNLTDEVRETVQQMLYRTLVSRTSVFG